ncbi:hypothetical protein LOAG_12206, partial [Loa loa]
MTMRMVDANIYNHFVHLTIASLPFALHNAINTEKLFIIFTYECERVHAYTPYACCKCIALEISSYQ